MTIKMISNVEIENTNVPVTQLIRSIVKKLSN